jgi:cell division initiation protein
VNITPIDIQQAGFKVRIRGYDRQEVDSFLDMLTDDFETLIKQNNSMKERVAELETQLQDLKKREAALNNTLVRAEDMVGQIQDNAQKEALLITKKAEVEAEEIVKTARNQVAEGHREIQDLKRQKLILIEKIRSMIASVQKLLDFEAEHDQRQARPAARGDQSAGAPDERRENAVSVLRPKP